MPHPDEWLVVIDMQEVFANPASEWSAPGTYGLLEPIGRLAPHFGPRVILTRYVSPVQPAGSWVPYFETFPHQLQPPHAHLWDLLDGLPEVPHERVVTEDTFSKWGPRLSAATHHAETLVMCGVATDCCVVATALAAADAGIKVRVVEDLCATLDDAGQARAIELMRGFAPLIEITDLQAELARH